MVQKHWLEVHFVIAGRTILFTGMMFFLDWNDIFLDWNDVFSLLEGCFFFTGMMSNEIILLNIEMHWIWRSKQAGLFEQLSPDTSYPQKERKLDMMYGWTRCRTKSIKHAHLKTVSSHCTTKKHQFLPKQMLKLLEKSMMHLQHLCVPHYQKITNNRLADKKYFVCRIYTS